MFSKNTLSKLPLKQNQRTNLKTKKLILLLMKMLQPPSKKRPLKGRQVRRLKALKRKNLKNNQEANPKEF
jgi:hypothetical protein